MDGFHGFVVLGRTATPLAGGIEIRRLALNRTLSLRASKSPRPFVEVVLATNLLLLTIYTKLLEEFILNINMVHYESRWNGPFFAVRKRNTYPWKLESGEAFVS